MPNTDLRIYDTFERKKRDDNKINMSIKNVEINNNSSSGNKNDKKYEFIIENNIEYSLRGKKKKDKEEDIETFSDKNLESALSIITKIMKNKEKDEKKNKINSLLLKIIQNKIKKDENQKLELIKKNFYLLKNKKKEIIPSDNKNIKKLKLDFLENNILNLTDDDLLSKTILYKKNNSNLPKTDRGEKTINFSESNEETLNKSKGKFRVVIKKIKIHKSITKNIVDSEIKKIKPIKSTKNCPFITDINEIPDKNITKKTISLTINENYNSLKDKNININTNKSDNNLDNKEDINKIQNDEQKENTNKGKNDEKKEEKKENIKENIKEYIKKDIKEYIMKDIKKNEKDNIKEKVKNKIKENLLIIEKEESFDNYKNISSNLDNIKENKNYLETNSEKKINNNLKIIKKNVLIKNKRKSYINIPIRKSIESFTKNRKNKSKLSKSNESGNGADITLNEKYQDYENLIYYLRVQLIHSFIQNKKNNELYND